MVRRAHSSCAPNSIQGNRDTERETQIKRLRDTEIQADRDKEIQGQIKLLQNSHNDQTILEEKRDKNT